MLFYPIPRFIFLGKDMATDVDTVPAQVRATEKLDLLSTELCRLD